jgi:phosphoglucomutase
MAIQFGTPGRCTVVAVESSSGRVRYESSAGVADLFPGLNTEGSPISPNQSIALLFDYLVASRKWTSGAAGSFAASHLVDRVAVAAGLSVHETPDGFKYIGETINEDKIVIGGKEPARFSNKGHYPAEDGILARLLTTKTVASGGARLGEKLNHQHLART